MTFKTIFAISLVSGTSAFAPKIWEKVMTTNAQAVAIDALSDEQANTIFDPLGLYPEDSQERKMDLIQSLESSAVEKDETVIDPLSLYRDQSQLTEGVEMSASLPFLKRPELLDGSLPGDRGFDPFNFASDAATLSWYRESEIKHARLAMLAAVGWPVAELMHKGLASQFDLEPALAMHEKVPSVLNGGFELTNPLFWVGAISAAAALEFSSTKNGDGQDFGFDPLNLAGRDEISKFSMQEAEIFNGRLAMLAITGFVAQEFANNASVIDQTPFFFKPFGNLVESLLASGNAMSV